MMLEEAPLSFHLAEPPQPPVARRASFVTPSGHTDGRQALSLVIELVTATGQGNSLANGIGSLFCEAVVSGVGPNTFRQPFQEVVLAMNVPKDAG